MTLDTGALRALIQEAVEGYRQELEKLKEQLESEFSGFTLGSSLQDELCATAPWLRLEDDYNGKVINIVIKERIEAEVLGDYIQNDHGDGNTEGFWEFNEIDLSPKLERALERARANAIALSAMGDMILEVVE